MEVARKDKDAAMRLAYLEVNSKRVVTPRRSLCLTRGTNSESRAILNARVRGINELPRRISKERLEDIDTDLGKQEEFYSDIEQRFGAINPSDEVNMFLFNYENGNKKKGEPNKTPSDTETEYLCGLLNHLFNDIWVPPVVPGLSGSAYIPYLEKFYDYAATNYRTPLAGLVPHVARMDIRRLSEIYIRHGINYFVMDFAGKNPFAQYANIVQVIEIARMIERETKASCFLHGINVPFTRSLWKNPVILARDILLFALGFSCFGSSHIYRPSRRLPKEVIELMQTKPKRYRLFNRRDYGYYRDDEVSSGNFDEENDVKVTLQDFRGRLTRKETRTLETLFNVERHGLEADELRTKLIEGDSIKKHLTNKKQIPPAVMNRILSSNL